MTEGVEMYTEGKCAWFDIIRYGLSRDKWPREGVMWP